jgi:hypothetical protein
MQRSTGTMVVAAAFVLAACGSTTLTDVWKAPDTARLQFKKVLVVAISTDITWRRTIEDELVRRIRDVQAVASYQFFADGEPREWEAARERLKAAGFDGLITFRLAGVDKQQTYVPPVYANRGVGGYWGYAWPAVYTPGSGGDARLRDRRRQARLGQPEPELQSGQRQGPGQRGGGRRA